MDGGDGASFAGDVAAVAGGCQGDDAVSCGVVLTAWRFQLRSDDGAGGEEALTGPVVEVGDVAASPGEQHRLVAGDQIGLPRSDGGVERFVPCRRSHEPVVAPVPIDCLGDAAASELLERGSLGHRAGGCCRRGRGRLGRAG